MQDNADKLIVELGKITSRDLRVDDEEDHMEIVIGSCHISIYHDWYFLNNDLSDEYRIDELGELMKYVKKFIKKDSLGIATNRDDTLRRKSKLEKIIESQRTTYKFLLNSLAGGEDDGQHEKHDRQSKFRTEPKMKSVLSNQEMINQLLVLSSEYQPGSEIVKSIEQDFDKKVDMISTNKLGTSLDY